METVFNEIQHSVKNWWTSLLLGIVYIIVALWLMFSPVSTYVALSIIFSVSMLISGILEIIFALSNRKGVPSWGVVYRRRTHRPRSGYLPDCLSDDQHGSYPFHHSLLAYVPRVLLHRLFHRPETLRNPRLGLVHGFRYSCHPVLSFNIMATRHRSALRSVYDFFCFPHHRTFPCHAFI